MISYAFFHMIIFFQNFSMNSCFSTLKIFPFVLFSKVTTFPHIHICQLSNDENLRKGIIDIHLNIRMHTWSVDSKYIYIYNWNVILWIIFLRIYIYILYINFYGFFKFSSWMISSDFLHGWYFLHGCYNKYYISHDLDFYSHEFMRILLEDYSWNCWMILIRFLLWWIFHQIIFFFSSRMSIFGQESIFYFVGRILVHFLSILMICN